MLIRFGDELQLSRVHQRRTLKPIELHKVQIWAIDSSQS